MNGDTQIIVSGREYKVPGNVVSYEQVVKIWNELHQAENRPCRTASGPASGTGAASVPTPPVKSPRPRWPTWSATRWKRPMRVRTCSSAGAS